MREKLGQMPDDPQTAPTRLVGESSNYRPYEGFVDELFSAPGVPREQAADLVSTLDSMGRLTLVDLGRRRDEIFRQQGITFAITGPDGAGVQDRPFPLDLVPRIIPAIGVLGAPLLGFLVVEQQVSARSQQWQRRLFLELPIVSEQIGMLLSAGFSLSGALDRIASRGSGACARDLDRVRRRMRQGLSDTEALREWADLAQVPAVTRFVGVLTLNRETSDLGRLIAEEARAIRREAHRELIAQLDRRAQQVWVPVTVATLVPGTLLLAVPFLQAMQVFTDR